MGWRVTRLVGVSALLLGLILRSPAQAHAVNISAQVDKTAVELGGRFTLTITLDGDLANVNVQDFKLPQGLQVVAQSRASNVSLGLGEVRRSVSLIYVLLAQEPGTFQLGPFQVVHQGTPVLTEPIEIVVKKPVVPPAEKDAQRYLL